VQSLKGQKVSTLWQHHNAGWQTWDPPLPLNVNSAATFGQRDVLYRLIGGKAIAVLRQKQASRISLTMAAWEKGGFRPETTITGRNLEALALDPQGNLLARCTTNPGKSSEIRVTSGQAWLLASQPRGVAPGTAVVAHDADSRLPIVIVQGCGEELVAFHAPQKGRSAIELWRLPGRGQSTSWPWEALGPVIADLSGDGRRQLIYATSSPNGCARLVAADLKGRKRWHHDFPSLPGTAPVWNTGGIILWQTGHFTDRRRQDVLVTIRRSMMHSEESLLLSGRDGHELWHRSRQISQRGVGGTPFAIADYDGNGLDDLASFHPSIFYILKGSTGQDIIAKDASWEGVPAKPVYWGLPLAGDFEGTGKMNVFFATNRSSMTGLIRPDGSLVWWDALDKSPSSWPAFGDFNGDGRLEMIGIGYEDGMRCYETATGKVRWHMPSPVPGNPAGSASADIDSDGCDEALFVIGQTLFCIGTAGDGKSGSLRWKIDLPVNAGPPTIADVNGSGKLSILLVGSDGFIYCVETGRLSL